jgi:hypothetical protein
MDERRDLAIVVLGFVAATCLAVFFLGSAQPSGTVIARLFASL